MGSSTDITAADKTIIIAVATVSSSRVKPVCLKAFLKKGETEEAFRLSGLKNKKRLESLKLRMDQKE